MYAPRIIRRKVHWPTALVTSLACLLAGGALVFATWRFSAQSPLPVTIQKQVQFPVFIPSTITVDQRSYKFDRPSGVLSFTATLADGKQVTFTEQAAPSSFTDIPNFYSQFLQTLYEYQSFDCLNGTMYLTHPKNAGQAAVMSSKGTLMFARVSKDEAVSTWQQVCNGLEVYAQ